jgi:Transposase DDE domain
MDIANQLTRILCEIDDFCKEFDANIKSHLLPSSNEKAGPRGREPGLSVSEIMTILVMFHQIRFRDFKTFYCFVGRYWKNEFPSLPGYTRFISIMNRAILPLIIFTQLRSGKRTEIYYIDSSCLPVCHIKRSKRHKTFDQVAEYGKTSVGWFFGLKLHVVINDTGQLIAFKMTRGNQHDAKEAIPLLNKLEGLAFGDKGYLGEKIFDELLAKGLKLITRKRKNMKKEILTDYEQQLLNQRGIIETVIGHLKHHYQVWHTRHRSMLNAMTHLVSALAAYVIEPLKISAIKLLGEIA